ncbi:hydroxymethylbilane synthase [Botrimarina sp.]|uniref:hydroxymethylbilane synthase n=1 Tax=Botrimarina sp. TaxID=2795802 RepID=UPI0032ED6914
MPTDRPLRLGTRGSQLARWQSQWVAERLRSCGHSVELVEVRTLGDARQSGPISEIVDSSGAIAGGQGVFTKELQRALLAGQVDLAVHSLKDLPTAPVEGLTLAAAPERAPVADVLVSPTATRISDLSNGARVGTGSFRRKAQLLNRRPDLRVSDLRGNLDTRLAKLDRGEHDAILLAEAGLARLGWSDRLAGRIPPHELLPAPGQGALGVECRADDSRTLAALALLEHWPTRAAVTAERSALARLEGGCLAALGAWGRFEGDSLRLSVVVLSDDGVKRLDAELADLCPDARAARDIGHRVADELLSRGAGDLLRSRG